MAKKIKKLSKSTLILAISALALLLAAPAALACDITVTVAEPAKDVFQPGEEVILKVSVHLSHRNCPEGIDATMFNSANMELLGATDWTQTDTRSYERLVKVRLGETGEAMLMVKRTCDKEGGYAEISLTVA